MLFCYEIFTPRKILSQSFKNANFFYLILSTCCSQDIYMLHTNIPSNFFYSCFSRFFTKVIVTKSCFFLYFRVTYNSVKGLTGNTNKSYVICKHFSTKPFSIFLPVMLLQNFPRIIYMIRMKFYSSSHRQHFQTLYFTYTISIISDFKIFTVLD